MKYIILYLLFLNSVLAQEIQITLVKNTQRERETKATLEKILKDFELTRYFYTQTIRIEEYVIPHSHPILTLHTKHKDDPDMLMAVFIHEELHWFLDKPAVQVRVKKLILELQKKFPKIPVGREEGSAADKESSYLHLIVCTLELQGMSDYVGMEKARGVLGRDSVYRALKKMILDDYEYFAGKIKEYQLTPPVKP